MHKQTVREADPLSRGAAASRFAAGMRMEPVIRQLSRWAPLSADELSAVRDLDDRRKEHEPGAAFATEGSILNVSRFLVSGWACHQQLMPDGRRQIFSFLLPGDILRGSYISHSRFPAVASTVALTPLITVELPKVGINAITGATPIFTRAISAAIQDSEMRLRDHVLRLGRMNAVERMAHLLLELLDRLAAVGLSDGYRLPFPLTQDVLADGLGLSVVHVNRTMQYLRRIKAIEYSTGEILITARNQLDALAQCRAPMAS